MLSTEEILESLDLSRAEPGSGFLQALVSRFNARVPFETASKILRNRDVSDPAEKPRWPDVFWREHLESGTGGTCFARVAAFAELLEALGFPTRKALGRVRADRDHSALLVQSGGVTWVCDVGFPLPEAFPLAGGTAHGTFGSLGVAATTRGLSVEFPGVPDAPRRLEIFLPAVEEEEFRACWRGTFRPGSPFLSRVSVLRRYENRTVAFAAGELRVDDEHSRLTLPLAAPRPARLAEIFGVDARVLSGALETAGDPDSANRPSLAAYLETDASPEAAFAAIGDREAHARLLADVAVPSGAAGSEREWRWTLLPDAGDGDAGLVESLSVDAGAGRVSVVRETAGRRGESEWRVLRRDDETWLVREAFFEGPREDLLRNDSLRGRLAASLSADLLAWSRIVNRES